MTTTPTNSIKFLVFSLFRKIYVVQIQTTIVDEANFIE